MTGLQERLDFQAAFNLRRWAEISADAELARVEGRVETDRHGHVLMSPPPAARHGSLQSEIAYLLRTLMSSGRVFTECPISTADGVKAADVAWASSSRVAELGDGLCFARAPEICVEVQSPGNTDAELRQKAIQYLLCGAREVWLCATSGAMTFLDADSGKAPVSSALCPEFPAIIRLR
jgi:Uma2 family endonuclease